MEEVLRLENVTQIKNERIKLKNINMHIFKGEIMGLVAINFLGQKELIELLCKNLPIHYGRIYYNETLVNSYNYSSHRLNRIAVIEKQSRLVEDLSVADNIFVLRKGFRKYLINRKLLYSQLRQFTNQLGMQIDGNVLVGNLSALEKNVVELLKAIVGGAKLIIIENISSQLGSKDLLQFQELLHYYATRGVSFLYICNHHEEAFKICDRMSIMENGQILKVFAKSEFTRENIKPFYISEYNRKKDTMSMLQEQKEILRFEQVHIKCMQGLNLRIIQGECVVIQDISNTVLRDIIDIMSGMNTSYSGTIYLQQQIYHVTKKQTAVKQGICFVDEYPTESMVFGEMSFMENLCFLLSEKIGGLGVTNKIRKSVIKEYESAIGDAIYQKNVLMLKRTSLYSMVYYRIHLYHPKVVFLVQPFSGADLYERMHIIHLIKQLKKKGITIVILAVNLSDSLMIADRLIMIEKGRFKDQYTSQEFEQFNQDATIS
ncbi:MAG: ATP-binding cassette domain-containing protein [Lachnospiraceae bacterium]